MKKMTNGQLKACKDAGFTIPGKALFGADKQELRKEALDAGARFDGKDSVWVFPDDETCSQFEKSLGLTDEIRKSRPDPTEEPQNPADMLVTAAIGGGNGGSEPEQKPKAKEVNGNRPKASKGLMRLPPSLLVGGSISVPGDVRYETLGEEVELLDEGDIQRRERTKTTKKIVRDPEGHEAAHQLAGRLRGQLKKLCQATPFGWMCRVDKEAEIDGFIAEAKAECKEFNANSKYHFVRFSLIKGRIDSDDEAAARDIAYEMQRLFGEMRLALESCDVKRIRALAVKGLAIKPMLSDTDQTLVQDAIDSARAEARKIVKEVGVKGEQIETVKDEVDTSVVEVARLSFLDYEAPSEMPSADRLVNEERYQLDTEESEPVEPPAPMDKGQFDLDFSTN
jgi:hypothetical protein